jgi:uncharacterized membrane protein
MRMQAYINLIICVFVLIFGHMHVYCFFANKPKLNNIQLILRTDIINKPTRGAG